jgi:NADH-quinone oxidoreductase subunit N
MTVVMTVFLFSLAGIPPLGGWFAKFYVFKAIGEANTPAGWILGVIVAVNSVIALVYYAGVARRMWTAAAPDDDRTPIRVPAALASAIGLCTLVVVALGIYPQAFARLGDLARLTR